MVKRILSILLIVIFGLFIVAGCGSKSYDPDWATDATYTYDDDQKGDTGYGGGRAPGSNPEDSLPDQSGSEIGIKVIRSGYMTIQTLDFEETIHTIQNRLESQGGFVASSNIQGVSREARSDAPMRRAQFKVRIPSKYFDGFFTDAGDLGSITKSGKTGEDITGKYYDTKARVIALETQEDRLLSILEQADKLQDILELEKELGRVRYEIERLTGTIRNWDGLVKYSTIDIEVFEVEEIKKVEAKPVTLQQKISRGFKNSLDTTLKIGELLLVFVFSAIPFLLLFSFIGLILYIIVKLILRVKR